MRSHTSPALVGGRRFTALELMKQRNQRGSLHFGYKIKPKAEMGAVLGEEDPIKVCGELMPLPFDISRKDLGSRLGLGRQRTDTAFGGP